MTTKHKASVFIVLSFLLIFSPKQCQARSVLQRGSSLPEVDCRLTRRELRRYSGDEEGQWVLNDSGLNALNGEIQLLFNCTEDGDTIFFDVEDPVQPASRIVIYWNLTLSAFVQGPRDENDIFPRTGRKVIFVCPREDEGVFVIDANDSLFENFIFQNCSLNHRTGEEQYGLITTRKCSSSQNLGTIAFHHIDFEANFLNTSAALFVQEPSCSVINIVDVNFHNNTCVGVCAASLPTWSEIRNMSLTTNSFLDKDVHTPTLIRIHSGSNATIDGLVASRNNGTVVYVQNATLRISNSYIYNNTGDSSQIEDHTGNTVSDPAPGQILDSRFEAISGAVGSSIVIYNSSSVIRRTSVIGSTSTGRGGAVFLFFGINVQILNSFIANNSASISGGGIFSDRTRNLKIENTSFEMNTAERGGGLYFAEGDLEITKSSFLNNTGSAQGGGLYFSDGTLTITESNVINCSTDGFGGGWYIYSSVYTLVNLLLFQNEANSGGGFSIMESSGSLNNSYFERNSARSNGGGFYISKTNLSVVYNCTFANNLADQGGGMYGEELTFGSVLSSDFVQNRVIQVGGGILLRNGTLLLDKNTFEVNESNELGGGLACMHSELNISNTSFVGNIARHRGAGIYMQESTYGWFANCTWSGNNANTEGGGICLHLVSQIMISSSVFDSNQASIGAGVSAWKANVTLINTIGNNNTAGIGSVTLFSKSYGTLFNCSLGHNTAESIGALSLSQSVVEVSSSEFKSNIALLYGGAISCSRSSNLTIKNCLFSSNFAGSSGGAILVIESVLFATNLQFQNNRAASFGGAVSVSKNSSFSLSNSTFQNEVSDIYGGAISATNAGLNLTDVFIHSCSASFGGGIYFQSTSANINDTSVASCNASRSGGGIHLTQSNVTSSGLNISFNTVVKTLNNQQIGGGVHLDTFSRLNIRNATLIGNTAQLGAGMSLFGKSIINVSNGYFYNNSARLSGGAAYIQNSSGALDRVLFDSNNAFYGGSLCVYNASLTVNNSHIINSSSTDAGGSIFAQKRSVIVIKGTTILTSKAINGGGIMLEESSFWGLRVQFTECQARHHGGGVYLNKSSFFLCADCLFQENSAIEEGGAIRLTSSKPQMLAFQLDNCQFYNNTANFGGGIHFQSGDGSANCSDVSSTACTFLALTGCVFVNNYATFSGGAILANNPSAIRFSCNVSIKTDPFAYYSPEELGKLTKLESLDVLCGNWARNNASIYGPVVGSYARRVSTSIVFKDNKTVEIPGNHYTLKNHQSGTPLPIINLEAADQYNQGPAFVQGNGVLRAEMTPKDGFFYGFFTVVMENSQGKFQGVTGFKEPGTYHIQIEFSQGGMPTLIIAVEIRHCVIGESRAANGTLCELCSGATYNFYPRNKEKTCVPCPENARCDSIAIQPKEGFWHQTPCSIHIQECLSETACKYQNREDRLIQIGSKIQDCVFNDDFVGKYSKEVCKKGIQDLFVDHVLSPMENLDHSDVRDAMGDLLMVS